MPTDRGRSGRSTSSGEPAAKLAPAMAGGGELVGTTTSWSLADAFVAAGVCVTAALLFAPFLLQSQISAQRQVCEEKMQRIGAGLLEYARLSDGQLPMVPESGPLSFAAVYAPTLIESQLIDDPCCFLCPTAGGSDAEQPLFVPSLAQIRAASHQQVRTWRTDLKQSYAYSLGYQDEAGELPPTIGAW